MIDSDFLKEKINKSNYNTKYIAKELQLSERELIRKIENKRELNASEIYYLIKLLNLTLEEQDHIFFNNNVEKYSTISRI